MKPKIIFSVFAMLIVVAVTTWNVTLGSEIERKFNVTLANNEALAQNEGGDDGGNPCAGYIDGEAVTWTNCGGILKKTFEYFSLNCTGFGSGDCVIGEKWSDWDCSGNLYSCYDTFVHIFCR